jgi:type IV secretory pathway protease TraF
VARPRERRRSACSWTAARTVVALHASGILLVGILAIGPHVNLFACAPRGLYSMVAASPTLRARVVVSVGHVSATLARARGYLGPGLCASGVEPVLEPVVGFAGDVVEFGPGR